MDEDELLAFTAKGVATITLENALCVVLAEDPDDAEGARLEIMRGLSFDEQDRRLGLATYSLSTQTGATIHGGVVAYSLVDDLLLMHLNGEAQDTLGIPEQFTIRLDAEAATVESVRVALRSILQEVHAAPSA